MGVFFLIGMALMGLRREVNQFRHSSACMVGFLAEDFFLKSKLVYMKDKDDSGSYRETCALLCLSDC